VSGKSKETEVQVQQQRQDSGTSFPRSNSHDFLAPEQRRKRLTIVEPVAPAARARKLRLGKPER